MRIQILMQRLGIAEVSREGIESVEGAGSGVVVSGAWVPAGAAGSDEACATLRFPELQKCARPERAEGVVFRGAEAWLVSCAAGREARIT